MAFNDKIDAPEPKSELILRDPITRQIDRVERIVRIRQAFVRLGIILPPRIDTRAELRAAIRIVCRQRLRYELQNDPQGLGYAGKTDAEIAALLNNPWIEQIPAIPGPGTVPVTRPPRIFQIWLGIAYAPNAVDANDVAEFKV